jgi:hypothetical protein
VDFYALLCCNNALLCSTFLNQGGVEELWILFPNKQNKVALLGSMSSIIRVNVHLDYGLLPYSCFQRIIMVKFHYSGQDKA